MIGQWFRPGGEQRDLRREAETRRLARTLRNGSPRSYRWIPVLWWKLSRYGGRVLKSFGQRRASV